LRNSAGWLARVALVTVLLWALAQDAPDAPGEVMVGLTRSGSISRFGGVPAPTQETKRANERTILLAEDSADDAELVRRAFRRAGYDNPIQAVCRGEEVLQYLKGEGEYGDRMKFPIPHLILIDAGLVGMSGWEVLAWLRLQPGFKSLPAIIFTGSEQPGDKQKAESLGASACETKPQAFDEFVRVVKKLGDSWLGGASAS
jgi:CheY-like chemotaxis protein